MWRGFECAREVIFESWKRERSRVVRSIDPTFGGRYGPQFPEINKARTRPLRAANEQGQRRNEFSYSRVFSSLVLVPRLLVGRNAIQVGQARKQWL